MGGILSEGDFVRGYYVRGGILSRGYFVRFPVLPGPAMSGPVTQTCINAKMEVINAINEAP